jgi:hypothetical protein
MIRVYLIDVLSSSLVYTISSTTSTIFTIIGVIPDLIHNLKSSTLVFGFGGTGPRIHFMNVTIIIVGGIAKSITLTKIFNHSSDVTCVNHIYSITKIVITTTIFQSIGSVVELFISFSSNVFIKKGPTFIINIEYISKTTKNIHPQKLNGSLNVDITIIKNCNKTISYPICTETKNLPLINVPLNITCNMLPKNVSAPFWLKFRECIFKDFDVNIVISLDSLINI